MNESKEFYVYGLIDPRNMQVFYIGKGKGNRATQHFKETLKESQGNHDKIKLINEIKDSGIEPVVCKYISDVNEEAAFFLEEILIDRIGRKILNYGPLTNMTVGGINDGKLVFSLEQSKKVNIEIAILKYPVLKNIINSIPRTTKEDEIENYKNQIVKEMCEIINSIDSQILNEIKACNINYLSHYKKKGIQFDSKFGYCEITFDTSVSTDEKSSSSMTIRNNKNIIFHSSFYISQIEIINELKEFIKE